MIKRKKCTKLDTHMDSSVKGNFYFFPILANNHVTNAYWHSRKNTNAAVKLSLFICSLSGTLKLHAVLNVEFSPLAESRFAYPTCIRRISGFAAYRSIQCYQPYEWRSVKNKAATNGGKRRAEHSPWRPSSVVRTRLRRSVCDGLDVMRRRRREVNPAPLVITPVFCCRRIS